MSNLPPLPQRPQARSVPVPMKKLPTPPVSRAGSQPSLPARPALPPRVGMGSSPANAPSPLAQSSSYGQYQDVQPQQSQQYYDSQYQEQQHQYQESQSQQSQQYYDSPYQSQHYQPLQNQDQDQSQSQYQDQDQYQQGYQSQQYESQQYYDTPCQNQDQYQQGYESQSGYQEQYQFDIQELSEEDRKRLEAEKEFYSGIVQNQQSYGISTVYEGEQENREYCIEVDEHGNRYQVESAPENDSEEEVLVTINNVNVTHYKNARWRPLLTGNFIISRAPFDKRTLLWKIEGRLALEKSEKMLMEKELKEKGVSTTVKVQLERRDSRECGNIVPPPINRDRKPTVGSFESPSVMGEAPILPPRSPAQENRSLGTMSSRRGTRVATTFDPNEIAAAGIQMGEQEQTEEIKEDETIVAGDEATIWGFFHNTKAISSPVEYCYLFIDSNDEIVFVQLPFLEITSDMAKEFDLFIRGWTFFICNRTPRLKPLPKGCCFVNTPTPEPPILTPESLKEFEPVEDNTKQKRGVAGSIENSGLVIGSGFVRGAEALGRGMRAGTKFYIKHRKPKPVKPGEFSEKSSEINNKVSSALLTGTCFFLNGIRRGGEYVGQGIAKGIYAGVNTYQSTDYAKKKEQEKKRKERESGPKASKPNAVVSVATSTIAAGCKHALVGCANYFQANIVSGLKQAVKITATDIRDTSVERTLHRDGAEAARLKKQNFDTVGDYCIVTAHGASLGYKLAMTALTGGAYAGKEAGETVGKSIGTAAISGAANYDNAIKLTLGGLWHIGWVSVLQSDFITEWVDYYAVLTTFALALYVNEQEFEYNRWEPYIKINLDGVRGVCAVPKDVPKKDYSWRFQAKNTILFFSLQLKNPKLCERDETFDYEAERTKWIEKTLALASILFPDVKGTQSVLGFGSEFKRRDGFLMKKGDLKKNWKLRWFVLDKTGLTYYDIKEEKDPKEQKKWYSINVGGNKEKEKEEKKYLPLLDKPLRTIKREQLVDAVLTHTVTAKEKQEHQLQYIFTIKTEFRSFEVAARTFTEMQGWIESIQMACPLR